jgi:hypothetical protein
VKFPGFIWSCWLFYSVHCSCLSTVKTVSAVHLYASELKVCRTRTRFGEQKNGSVGYDLISIKDSFWPKARMHGDAPNLTYGSSHDFAEISISLMQPNSTIAVKKFRLGELGATLRAIRAERIRRVRSGPGLIRAGAATGCACGFLIRPQSSNVISN